MKKLLLFSLTIILLATSTIFGCKENESTLTKVRLNEVAHSIFYAPQDVAIELGDFEEDGIPEITDLQVLEPTPPT